MTIQPVPEPEIVFVVGTSSSFCFEHVFKANLFVFLLSLILFCNIRYISSITQYLGTVYTTEEESELWETKKNEHHQGLASSSGERAGEASVAQEIVLSC
jgi:hypothetical protein